MVDQINSLTIEIGDELLPIGTVVTLEIVEQAVMIYGRKQQKENNNQIWDYVACPYPQGHISNETNVFLNHDQIVGVIFRGLENYFC
ncbi:DUF4176 domain-containing protein [Aquibacillus rhizosphaerae]|uniref:DUF4176 domain-containing protein n=1 Tax=Aquibacillus rhizosphaerae TaxID=3051431 RepID=A0ABT7LA64_9BACI|nr:DUF4176 domain-containing protein [Aquibacillus sp. LR5S19]MDL4842137.1 DUF4176 domain-containing protein [Aquibacillus sp. LR5S19]